MKMTDEKPLTPDEFADLGDFVRCSTGLHFDESKKLTISHSVSERMKAILVEESAVYIRHLKSDPKEMEELTALLTVPETYFFRDKNQFEALTNTILPGLIASKKSKCHVKGRGHNVVLRQQEKPRVKILSCGCSSGEEPYSIAIALLQSGLIDQAEIEIIAFDITKKLIEKAQRAEYTKNSFREEDTEFLDAYFDTHENRFILQERVRKLVQFTQANIFDVEKMDLIFKDVDIIFFRNVTIYFTREDVKRAINIIAGKLSKEGHLFLGFSESLFQVDDRFEVEKIGNAYIWRRKGKAKKKETFSKARDLQEIKKELFSPPITPDEDGKPITVKSLLEDSADKKRREKISATSAPADQSGRAAEPHYENAARYVAIKMFDKAEREFKEQLKITPQHTGSLLGLARIYADSGKDDLAISACHRAIAIDNLLAESYFIIGLVHCKKGEFLEAALNFKKTIYSDEEHFTAQFYLGQIYHEMGEKKKAEQQFCITLDVIEKLGSDALSQEVSGCLGNTILNLCMDKLS